MSTQIKTAVVSRESLKARVQKAMTVVPTGTIFVAGVRKIKDYEGTHQMMLEVVQLKNLKAAGEKEYLFTKSKIEDGKFIGNLRTIRVWLKMTIDGYEKMFPQLAEQISGAELHKQVGQLKDLEVLSIFTPFDAISLPSGEVVVPTISVRQYSDETDPKFPTRISKILNTDPADRTPQQEEDLKGLAMSSNEGEKLVDCYGNQVYEMNEFTYGDDNNILISKMPISEYDNYIFEMKNILSDSKQSDICKSISNNESLSWSLELIEKYEDKWDWNNLSKNVSVPWTVQLIHKFADKLSSSKPIWDTLKPYVDDEMIEEVFKKM